MAEVRPVGLLEVGGPVAGAALGDPVASTAIVAGELVGAGVGGSEAVGEMVGAGAQGSHTAGQLPPTGPKSASPISEKQVARSPSMLK